MAIALASLTVLFPVSLALHVMVSLMLDRLLQVSRPSEVSGQIRDVHRKTVSPIIHSESGFNSFSSLAIAFCEP
jgi:hypothetical protein